MIFSSATNWHMFLGKKVEGLVDLASDEKYIHFDLQFSVYKN